MKSKYKTSSVEHPVLGILSVDEYISIAKRYIEIGNRDTAITMLSALKDCANKNKDYNLREDCLILITENQYQLKLVDSDNNVAASPFNREPKKPDGYYARARIFHPNLDEERIIIALTKIKFNRLKERRYWFVIKRIFEELNWLSVKTDTKFADWVDQNFNWPWEKNNPWRTVDKEIRRKNSWQWNIYAVPNNKDVESYGELAKILWNTFTEKPKRKNSDKPVDKETFYLPYKKVINNGQ